MFLSEYYTDKLNIELTHLTDSGEWMAAIVFPHSRQSSYETGPTMREAIDALLFDMAREAAYLSEMPDDSLGITMREFKYEIMELMKLISGDAHE